MTRDYSLFSKVLGKIRDGMSITFTKENIVPGDDFLILGHGYDSCTITFKRPRDLWWVLFDNDEPMLLEDIPDSFLRSILKNLLKNGNGSIHPRNTSLPVDDRLLLGT